MLQNLVYFLRLVKWKNSKKSTYAIGAPYLGLNPPRTPRPATLTLPTREPDVKRENSNSKSIVKCYIFL